METLYKILGLMGAGMIIWYLYHTIKNRPEMFAKGNMSKSFSTMGILALILIGFIALMVLLLRNG